MMPFHLKSSGFRRMMIFNVTQNTVTHIIFSLILLLLNGCTQSVGIREMENGLNNLVGTSYTSNPAVSSKNWSKISETEVHIELEQSFYTGCSYAILVNKNNDIIESWRFTSDKSLCKQRIYVPGV
jgi:hypothetical protein